MPDKFLPFDVVHEHKTLIERPGEAPVAACDNNRKACAEKRTRASRRG